MMEKALKLLRSFDGVLEVAPVEGDDVPPIAWGDHFFYYAPDGIAPRRQPYATIITKNYPDDVSSDLDRPGRWRLNIHVGRELVAELTPDASAAASDPAAPDPAASDTAASDTVLPHPLYGRQGWIAIVEPGPATADLTERLLRQAHDDDRRRVTRSGD